MKRETKNLWARDWFSGNAYCPNCSDHAAMSTVDSDDEGTTRTETWSCGQCGHRWKIEMREAAALADAHAPVSDWIERAMTDDWVEVLTAATICTELRIGTGDPSKLPAWAKDSKGEANYHALAKRARQVLGDLERTR